MGMKSKPKSHETRAEQSNKDKGPPVINKQKSSMPELKPPND